MKPKVKLLFLDVDGVLNNDQMPYLESWPLTDNKEHNLLRESISPTLVARVKSIIDATGAKVVLSSSWRYIFNARKVERVEFNLEEIFAFFETLGFDTSSWLGCTPAQYPGLRFSSYVVRGLEIQHFINTEMEPGEVSSIVILDDVNNMAHLSSRLIYTDDRIGITEADVKAAIKMFEVEDDAHLTFKFKN